MTKKNKAFLALLVILCCIVVVILAFLLRGNGTVQSNPSDLSTSYDEEFPEVVIQTPYGALRYPNRWGNQMQAECIDANPYIVRFWACVNERDQIRLFDIVFGQADEPVFGHIQSGDQSVAVHVIISHIEFNAGWNEGEKDTVYEMQECANIILDNLNLKTDVPADPVDTEKVSTEPDATADIVIETPYGTLLYPNCWENQIRIIHVSQDPYVVEFYGAVDGQKEQHLFDVCFGNNADNAWGIIELDNGEQMMVSVALYEILHDSSWTAEQYDRLLMMQEQLNYLIERIPFVDMEATKEETVSVSNGQDIRIETPYGSLRYPGKWEAFLRLEHSDHDGYEVAFFCELPDREEVYLFSVIFGREQGDLIGMIDNLPVCIHFGEIILEGSWTEDEMNIVYAMSEEVNYVFESFSDVGGFKFS